MISIEVSVRRALPDDRAALDALVVQASAGIRDARGGSAHLDVDGSRWSIAARLADPEALVLVGLIDQAIVGFTVVSSRSTANSATSGRIEAIYVEPEARAVSVGEELLNAAVAWATARGCAQLDAIALPGDRQTKNFFETFGMVARAIVVSRRLTEH